MPIPFEPLLFGYKINIHLVIEYLAYFIAFRYYIYLRNKFKDKISSSNRLSILLGAIIGAYIGSRLVGFLEYPLLELTATQFVDLLHKKTIMGGLLGGLIGVEITKKWIKETQSSGDLFTFPLILGIGIGRIGCFLSGTKEFTYGFETHLYTGMNLGDGINRHPIALYEIGFLFFLFLFLKSIKSYTDNENGLLFKLFMISYFGFRFFIEFIKPNIYFTFGLSSIQWICILCWIYYIHTLKKIIKNAYKKIYLL